MPSNEIRRARAGHFTKLEHVCDAWQVRCLSGWRCAELAVGARRYGATHLAASDQIGVVAVSQNGADVRSAVETKSGFSPSPAPGSGVVGRFRVLRDTCDQSVAVRLLRRNRNLAETAAILYNRFLDAGEQTVRGSVLAALVERDLELIAGEGGAGVAPGALIREWVDSGYLRRSYLSGSTTDQYTLTAGAQLALEFLAGQGWPSSSATRSTVAAMVEYIVQLAVDCNPDTSVRMRELQRQRDALDRRIAAVRAGADAMPSTADVTERIATAQTLGRRIPSEVAQHAENMRALDRQVRAAAVTSDRPIEAIDLLLEGERGLADTEAGLAFDGFFELVFDAANRYRLDEALEQLRAHAVPGAASLVDELESLISTIAAEVARVMSARAEMDKALRLFLQSQQFLAHRAVRDAIKAAEASLEPVMAARGSRARVELNLDLRKIRISSIASWVLRRGRGAPPPPMEEAQLTEDDLLGDHMLLFPVDVAALSAQINAALDARQGAATCAEVMSDAAGPMHLGEVLHILGLAEQHALRDEAGSETAVYRSGNGYRTVRFPYFLFTAPIDAQPSDSETVWVGPEGKEQ